MSVSSVEQRGWDGSCVEGIVEMGEVPCICFGVKWMYGRRPDTRRTYTVGQMYSFHVRCRTKVFISTSRWWSISCNPSRTSFRATSNVWGWPSGEIEALRIAVFLDAAAAAASGSVCFCLCYQTFSPVLGPPPYLRSCLLYERRFQPVMYFSHGIRTCISGIGIASSPPYSCVRSVGAMGGAIASMGECETYVFRCI